jgi:hypothetical protein
MRHRSYRSQAGLRKWGRRLAWRSAQSKDQAVRWIWLKGREYPVVPIGPESSGWLWDFA